MIPEWLSAWIFAHKEPLQWAGLLSLLLLVLSAALAPVVALWLPPDFLSADRTARPGSLSNRTVLGCLVKGARNMVGAALVLAGTVMLIMPGQGVLSIVVGLGLMDFPGKRRALRRLAAQRRVLRAINRFRVRFGRPPLQVPEGDDPPAKTGR